MQKSTAKKEIIKSKNKPMAADHLNKRSTDKKQSDSKSEGKKIMGANTRDESNKDKNQDVDN